MVDALSIVSLSMSFGGFTVVDDISLNIQPDERHAILGPNGAGKTTLFNLITGDLRSVSGKILFYDEDVTAYPTHQRVRLGMRRTYQSSLLFRELTVRDNLFIAVRGVKMGRMKLLPVPDGHADLVATRKLLDQVRLGGVADRKVAELSHGQQRQLEIGMALAGEFRFILLDEPAAGLSPREREELVELLENLPKHVGFLIIEHDLDIALKLVDYVTIMNNGRIVTSGTSQEIVEDPAVRAIYTGVSESTDVEHA